MLNLAVLDCLEQMGRLIHQPKEPVNENQDVNGRKRTGSFLLLLQHPCFGSGGNQNQYSVSVVHQKNRK